MRNILRLSVLIALLLGVSASLRSTSDAQIRPVYDQGALGLTQLLKRLNTNASALMIGAHPDDEDTALLAYLARGENARTAYLSLTRGDGGQNILGPELGEALGVIRTEELLQARKLDGAEQFFTSAYDYGFSKTLAEAKQRWDEKLLLCEVVQVIRLYKPLVVISQFTGTAADGHGQHQFAGYIAPLAVQAAADPKQCFGGASWTVQKFYVRSRGQGEPTLRINTGTYDPLLGRSYFEIAMHARSQHRSQEQGVLELRGDQFSNLNLVDSKLPKVEKETSIFEGLELSVRNPITQTLDPRKPELLVPDLVTYHPEAIDLILRAAGIRIDVLTDRETVSAFEKFPVAVRVFVPPNGIEVKVLDITFPFKTEKAEEPPAGGTQFRRETPNIAAYFTLTAGELPRPTRPYWLDMPRRRDHFLSGRNSIDLHTPINSPPRLARLTMLIGGKQFILERPIEFRFADDIRGEIRRELNVVPAINIAPNKKLLIVPTQQREGKHEVSVTLTNNSPGPVSGKVWLNVPSGRASPQRSDYAMTRKGESTTVRFSITIYPNAPAGSFAITAEATVNANHYSESMETIAYEHIQTHRIYRPATVDVRLIDLQTAPVKVGYIRGSGDRVPDAIKQLGLEVTEIDEATLSSGDLSQFDTIVIGIRAYQVRPEVVANNRRLLDFANNGGVLIVQYQLPQTYANLTPFPATIGPRVADENAPVTILQPTHPILNFPNKITQEDFKDWVQERNLYNFAIMDPKYVGLLETHDAGEPENTGGLVVADIGKGKYVYCSYSLFRQLPAGVPRAYRLLANLVSLPKAGK
jgi:LmbE family N-acetylglucosaminyl deacetylase